MLLVGAGGIGCELLKDLILSGFGHIYVIDLDTVTLSNLNRQFLFRQKDIDKPKSTTVAKAVESFNYLGAKLYPFHSNIMDTTAFPIEWWDQFSFIFNALDNLEARRYVNKIALYLKKPLMESGTTGYDGQIQPIFPYISECFECLAKVTPKTFPVCTIRSTPSQPAHCITWAKEFLFKQLFDESLDDNVSRAQLQNETDDDKEIENILKESNELRDLKDLILTKSETTDGINQFVKSLIIKLYKTDIERSLRLESLWKTRAKPIPLNYEEIEADLVQLIHDSKSGELLTNETKVWSVLENLYVLYESGIALQKRIQGSESFILFDKDDEDTLNFVVAASNLRSSIFNIEIKSKFDIKQIAGNIIPAIATTNAIISGFSNLSSLRYYDEQQKSRTNQEILRDFATVFISIKPNKYITSAALEGPNPKCPGCGLVSRGILKTSKAELSTLTLGALIERIIEKYGYSDDISLTLGSSKFIYDPDFTDNVSKKLNEFEEFGNQEVLFIQDEEDELENLELLIYQDESSEFTLPDIQLRPKQLIEESKPVEDGAGATELLESEEPITIESEDEGNGVIEEAAEPSTKKRKIEVLEIE